MKKIILILMSTLIFLTGCSSNSEYIETVKSITFDDGKSINEIVNEKIAIGEFYILNKDKLNFEGNLFLTALMGPDKMFKDLKQYNPIYYPKNTVKWTIEGETKDGKIVLASSENSVVEIKTIQNGDYIEIKMDDIVLYDKKNKSKISKTISDFASVYISVLKENNYNSNDETTNETSSLESEFYPSGRIKNISDGPEEMTYQDTDINFNNLKSEIKILRKNLSDAKTNNNIKEDLSWQIANLDMKLRGLKLSKNLTSKEKKNLNEISKELKEIHTKAQKLWNN